MLQVSLKEKKQDMYFNIIRVPTETFASCLLNQFQQILLHFHYLKPFFDINTHCIDAWFWGIYYIFTKVIVYLLPVIDFHEEMTTKWHVIVTRKINQLHKSYVLFGTFNWYCASLTVSLFHMAILYQCWAVAICQVKISHKIS